MRGISFSVRAVDYRSPYLNTNAVQHKCGLGRSRMRLSMFMRLVMTTQRTLHYTTQEQLHIV